MSEIYDPVDPIKALGLITSKKRRVAMCPRCPDEPLVCTLDRAGAEFHCMACGGWFGFLAPRPADETPELLARCDEVKAAYEAQREASR